MTPEDLAALPLLDSLSADTLAAALPLLERVAVPAGRLVFDEGDPPGPMYLAMRGSAEVLVRPEGRELVLSVLQAPTFFGGLSFLQGRSRSSAIRARSDLDLIAVPLAVLDLVAEREPRGLVAVLRSSLEVTADRLRQANESIIDHFRARLEQLAQEERERELRHLLVHDLRSPLAICETGLTQLLERTDRYGPLTERQRRTLQRSRRSARFMKRLVDEILEVGRTEHGDERLARTTFAQVLLEALPESVAGAPGIELEELGDVDDFASLRDALRDADLHVEATPDVLTAPLLVDRFRLVQVLMNLVGNSLKHAPGWLAVRIRREDGRAQVAVVDRGPGVPENLREAIFDPYRQAGVKAEGVRRGFGLGLAGAARLVEALGGSIHAETGDDGVGAAIVFDFPWKT